MNQAIETRRVNAANILPGDSLDSLFVDRSYRDDDGVWKYQVEQQVHFESDVVEAKQLDRTIERDGYEMIPLEVHLADGTSFTVLDYDQGAVVRW